MAVRSGYVHVIVGVPDCTVCRGSAVTATRRPAGTGVEYLADPVTILAEEPW